MQVNGKPSSAAGFSQFVVIYIHKSVEKWISASWILVACSYIYTSQCEVDFSQLDSPSSQSYINKSVESGFQPGGFSQLIKINIQVSGKWISVSWILVVHRVISTTKREAEFSQRDSRSKQLYIYTSEWKAEFTQLDSRSSQSYIDKSVERRFQPGGFSQFIEINIQVNGKQISASWILVVYTVSYTSQLMENRVQPAGFWQFIELNIQVSGKQIPASWILAVHRVKYTSQWKAEFIRMDSSSSP